MSWKFVMSSRGFVPGTHLDKATKIAMQSGYKFIEWNGIIYFIDDLGIRHETGLKNEDMYD